MLFCVFFLPIVLEFFYGRLPRLGREKGYDTEIVGDIVIDLVANSEFCRKLKVLSIKSQAVPVFIKVKFPRRIVLQFIRGKRP